MICVILPGVLFCRFPIQTCLNADLQFLAVSRNSIWCKDDDTKFVWFTYVWWMSSLKASCNVSPAVWMFLFSIWPYINFSIFSSIYEIFRLFPFHVVYTYSFYHNWVASSFSGLDVATNGIACAFQIFVLKYASYLHSFIAHICFQIHFSPFFWALTS